MFRPILQDFFEGRAIFRTFPTLASLSRNREPFFGKNPPLGRNFLVKSKEAHLAFGDYVLFGKILVGKFYEGVKSTVSCGKLCGNCGKPCRYKGSARKIWRGGCGKLLGNPCQALFAKKVKFCEMHKVNKKGMALSSTGAKAPRLHRYKISVLLCCHFEPWRRILG